MASLVALLVIAPIPPHPEARASLRSIAEGLRFARQRRVVLATFAIDFNAMLFGMPSALFPQLALTVFNTGPAGYGLLNAAPALGAFLGAALSGWIGRIQRPGRGVIVAVAVWGVAIAALRPVHVQLPAGAALPRHRRHGRCRERRPARSIVQLSTPDRLRGRITVIHMLVVTSGPRLGDAEAAGVAAVAGPQFSVVSGGVMCLLGMLAVLPLFPQLLSYRHPPHQADDVRTHCRPGHGGAGRAFVRGHHRVAGFENRRAGALRRLSVSDSCGASRCAASGRRASASESACAGAGVGVAPEWASGRRCGRGRRRRSGRGVGVGDGGAEGDPDGGGVPPIWRTPSTLV